MNVVSLVFIGIAIGWLGGVLVPGRGFGGFWDYMFGIFGAIIGGSIFEVFGMDGVGFWTLLGTSIIGAVLFQFVSKFFTGWSRLEEYSLK